MGIIEAIDDPMVPITRACATLGVSRATLYRRTQLPTPRSEPLERAPSSRRLSDDEREAVLDVLHSEAFADQPPPEVYATLLSQGIYLASIRTMYRLLAERDETAERRAQRSPVVHVKPTLTATAPNQVWTWDITKLRGPQPGIFYCLYVIIDLFSRMVVGWLLAERENAAHAERLFADATARHGVVPGTLTVHADRGSPMKSDQLAELFAVLGVARSFSRPHVSDDNAFSEAQFKTLKYQPDYPGCFASFLHARAWCQAFFAWFNDHHQHSGIALFTPADVFYGRVREIAAVRQRALDDAYAAHPERFPNGPPRAALPPPAVAINPIALPDRTELHPELGAPAGGIRPPIARANASSARAAQGNRAPGDTRSRARGVAAGDSESGEDGEDATLPAASTTASCLARWADRAPTNKSVTPNPLKANPS